MLLRRVTMGLFTKTENAVYSITQQGREAEEQFAGRGIKGKVLTGLVECSGATTVDRLVGETGISREALKNVLERLKANGYVQSQG